jgi:hypothetical protein
LPLNSGPKFTVKSLVGTKSKLPRVQTPGKRLPRIDVRCKSPIGQF